MAKKMTPMHAKRLAHLAIFLATVKPKKFDLSAWAEHDGVIDEGDKKVLGIDQALRHKTDCKITPTADQLAHTCGTTACALGWAGSLPEFQKEGLQLVIPVRKICAPDNTHTEILWAHVKYKSAGKRPMKDFKAGEAFFGLTSEQSLYLFDPIYYDRRYPLPVDVTDRIEEMLRDEGYKALANKVAKCPRYRPWKNQYGRGLSLR